MRFVRLLSVVILILALCLPVYAVEPGSEHVTLSELSEEECVEFIQEHGVEIPEEYKADPNLQCH